jgi:inner membrane protein involved in colicin E2 resistance
MKSSNYSFLKLLAVGFIIVCTSMAWALLGTALVFRTGEAGIALNNAVQIGWGGPLNQAHPYAWYDSPTGQNGRKTISPESSQVTVRLKSDPKQKGLLWFRTYDVDFAGVYEIANPTPIEQTIYVAFQLPHTSAGCHDVSFVLGDRTDIVNPTENGVLSDAVTVPAGKSQTLKIAFKTRGMDQWSYNFQNRNRIRNFLLTMSTDFREINFPAGTGSPTKATQTGDGWQLQWSYPDVIGAQEIGMSMPDVLNPGPVAERVSFYAPVSLLFFATVVLVLAIARNAPIHPMNFFFIAAGFFSFHLLFAYLVDVLPVHASFLIAAGVSLLLVCGYIYAFAGRALSLWAVGAQIAYMVLFSYSFFIDGYSGLTIAIGSVLTLAFLMVTTAKVDWSQKFVRHRATPPPAPAK